MANRRQASWKPAIRRFLEYVQENSVLEIIHPGDSVVPRHTRPFMPIDQVQSYLTQNDNLELLSIIKELSLETELYPKDILRRYTAVFCTLLQSGHGEYIELFRHKSSLSDRSLPFSVHNPPPGFPSGTEESNMLADFCREQWRFCAAVIEDSDSDKHYEEDQVLPIIYKERLAGGGTANLWLIKLHPTYNQIVPDAVIPGMEELQNYKNTFVLKEYCTMDAQSYYDNEISAFRKIESNPNIIKYHGSFKRGDVFNLILEYADKKSLRDFYFREAPPSRPEHIIQLWDKLFHLIHALRGIHTVKPSGPPGPEIFQGWHQDVKPENILIVSNKAEHVHEWHFKLADLGISHFKLNSSTPYSAASDTYGTRTYGAPECYRPDPASFWISLRVNPNVDIWSLGCVYSEFLRWMAYQYPGVEEYRKERSEETRQVSRSIGGLDCFHNELTVLQSVRKSHEKSMDELRKKEFVNEPILDMLDSIVKMIEDMLLSSGERPEARTLWNRKISIIEKAEAGLRQINGGHSPSPEYLPPISKELLAHYPRPPDDGPPAQPPVLPPEFAHLYKVRPNPTAQRRSSKRSHSEMVMNEVGLGLTRSPEFYGDDFPAQQTPYLSHHNSPFSTPSPYSVHTPVFRSTFPSQFLDNRKQTYTQLNNPDQFSSLNAPFSPSTEEIESHHINSFPMRCADPSMPPPEKQQVPNSYHLPPQRPPHQPVVRRQTSSDYVTLDNVLDWRLGKTSGTDPGVPRLNRDLINRLHDREFIFLIDDSMTMLEHWPNVCKTFKALTYLVRETGDAKIDLYFTISQRCEKRVRKSKDLLPIVQAMEDEIRGKDSTTDINIRLTQILEEYKRNLDNNHWWRSKPKPLSLFIFTDGIWEEEVTASEPIQSAVTKLEDLRKDKRQIGVQFISFGDDPEGLGRLEHLDDRLNVSKDIVDTEPFLGNVWKMLLGPISEKYDSQNRLYTLSSREPQRSGIT